MRKVFLLSPAKVSGARAGHLLNPEAMFPLALEFRTKGASLADVFTFASGLYFKGKITYARRFGEEPEAVRVITSNAGLLPPETRLTPHALRAFGEVDISAADPAYAEPLARDARHLLASLAPEGRVILLGSIATAKYRDVLLEVFGKQLLFPGDFVGRGDMSRGALLLRCARSGEELSYTPVAGAVVSGKRAPRLKDT